jgi:nitrogen-specific signal transduction histidine kinase
MPKKKKSKEQLVMMTSEELHTIRHNIKNFLNIIGGNAQLLMLINNDEYTKKHCNEISDNIDKCVEYVDHNIPKK